MVLKTIFSKKLRLLYASRSRKLQDSLVRHVAEDLYFQHCTPTFFKRKKLYYFTFCSVNVLIYTVGVQMSNCYLVCCNKADPESSQIKLFFLKLIKITVSE